MTCLLPLTSTMVYPATSKAEMKACSATLGLTGL